MGNNMMTDRPASYKRLAVMALVGAICLSNEVSGSELEHQAMQQHKLI